MNIATLYVDFAALPKQMNESPEQYARAQAIAKEQLTNEFPHRSGIFGLKIKGRE